MSKLPKPVNEADEQRIDALATIPVRGELAQVGLGKGSGIPGLGLGLGLGIGLGIGLGFRLGLGLGLGFGSGSGTGLGLAAGVAHLPPLCRRRLRRGTRGRTTGATAEVFAD